LQTGGGRSFRTAINAISVDRLPSHGCRAADMVGSYMAFDSSTRKRIMDIVEELSRRELLALREIHDVGRTTDPATALQLLAAGIIRQVPNDHFSFDR
jgi:hypothetical protein